MPSSGWRKAIQGDGSFGSCSIDSLVEALKVGRDEPVDSCGAVPAVEECGYNCHKCGRSFEKTRAGGYQFGQHHRFCGTEAARFARLRAAGLVQKYRKGGSAALSTLAKTLLSGVWTYDPSSPTPPPLDDHTAEKIARAVRSAGVSFVSDKAKESTSSLRLVASPSAVRSASSFVALGAALRPILPRLRRRRLKSAVRGSSKRVCLHGFLKNIPGADPRRRQEGMPDAAAAVFLQPTGAQQQNERSMAAAVSAAEAAAGYSAPLSCFRRGERAGRR
eukprot:Hpha_TRINITY_DN1207_c0_g1::TRINITY_DN1207_c0_g1_i1::g.44767::m.44767